MNNSLRDWEKVLSTTSAQAQAEVQSRLKQNGVWNELKHKKLESAFGVESSDMARTKRQNPFVKHTNLLEIA